MVVVRGVGRPRLRWVVTLLRTMAPGCDPVESDAIQPESASPTGSSSGNGGAAAAAGGEKGECERWGGGPADGSPLKYEPMP